VQWGVLTRSVRDAAAAVDVMAGPMPGNPYAAPPLERPLAQEVGRDPGKLRIAFTAESLYGKTTHPENRAAVEAAAKRLADLGHAVEEAKPTFDRDALVLAYLTHVAAGVAGEVADFERWTGRTATPSSFEASTWFLVQIGRSLGAQDYLHARDVCQAAGRALGAFHERYDLLLTASTAHPPIRIGELALKPAERIGLGVLRVAPIGGVLRTVLRTLADTNLERTPNTQLFNQTGQPAISVPLHQTADGLPIGVQLSAAMGGEGTLVRVASQLEAAAPWVARRPRILA
jgi:amidase